ncbi:MAG: tRNA (adenosine(37)-N6)-threonylcarbamoyltransferase complex dimerization subunit type 1 TsaB [Solirubrobacteraceae bacterium]|nr:tRNA (adenosine(37)-N6)-threonylcarbamoyltransferase complex dimerization subunit type 1 TsaB [Solirubrobacteraceae bacterium]
MTILAFDTATAATVVGVRLADGTHIERRDDPEPRARPRHTAALLPLAREALEAVGRSWSDVERIGVGRGPGSFTGLRIGISSARALAQGLDVPLVGVSSLAALAAGVEGGRPVLAVFDARRGEAFVAGYADGVEVIAPRVATPDELPALAAREDGKSWLAIGDGALRFTQELERGGAVVPAPEDAAHRVSAAAVCDLTARAPDVGRDAVVPDYLRVPDAEITRRARQQ